MVSDVRAASLRRVLFSGLLAVALAGLVSDVGYFVFGWPLRIAELFSLGFEANVPTWYSTVLLFACASSLAHIAHEVGRAGEDARAWRGLALAFAYLSLDEAIEIHEHLGGTFDTGGVLYFDWVIPAAAFVAIFGAVYLRFLARLPAETRRGFVTAGAIYVSGALLMELPLGYWTERAGDDNLVYALIDFVEETLEMLGASLFLLALARHRESMGHPATASEAP
jgi:hypothetical protein